MLGSSGVQIANAAYDNTIGGTLPGAANVISGYGNVFIGNDTPGLIPSGAMDNVVQGNFIGTDKTGTVLLGNGGPGIFIYSFNNTIGGTQPGAGNIIAGSYGPGVFVEGGTGNSILGNSIYSNGGNPSFENVGQGIDLDSTYSANNNQGSPVLTSVSSSSGTIISSTFQSAASTTFRVECFANAAMDLSGSGQGQTYLGFATVSTNASGYASFTATFTTVVPRGYFISATATNLTSGDTSEFSKDLVVGSYLVTNTNDSGVGSLREAIYDANTLAYGTAANPDFIAFDIPTTDPGYQSGTGAFSIKPLSALPILTDTAIIDGYTESGASPNTLAIGDNAVLKIVLDGSLAGAVDGLVIAGGNSTVRGLVIDNFAYGSAIVLNLQGNDIVAGNFIGTDVTGQTAAANNIGIVTNSNGANLSTGNTIGGIAPADRNIISGNNSALPGSADGGGQPFDFGIDIDNGNLIQGNYIGTDKSGTSAVPNGTGIVVGSNNTIGGLSAILGAGAGNLISGNIGFGIDRAGNQNLIAGNLIGTTATGLAALGNGAGVHLWGNNNTIGGTAAGARNIISGNTNPFGASGVDIENVGSGNLAGGSYNLVEGNYIGTDITGTTSMGLSQSGIGIAGAYNTIGGTTAAARNVISGNNGNGIQINGGFYGSIGNVIQGNYIGTDPSGTQGLPDGTGVILGAGVSDTTVGGTAPGSGNLIFAGGSGAVALFNCSGNIVQGNLINTDKTGTVPLDPSRRLYGVNIHDATNNLIGGTIPGAGNTIGFCAGPGVYVDSGSGNSILGNSIYGNGGILNLGGVGQGIVLLSTGNANDNQAAPVLTSVSTSSNGTTITGTLQSVASTTFRVEFFANAAMDPSGDGQGQTFLGFATLTTDASGNASFTATFSTVVGRGYFISATTTNLSTGDTSQFSKDLVAISYLVTNTNDSGVGSLREAIYDANTLAYGTAANPDFIAFDIPTTDPGYQSGTGAFSIKPLSALPTLTDTAVIDGYTEPGASPNTLAIGDNAVLKIVLDGSQAGAVDGLVIAGGNSTVRGLVIDNFAEGAGLMSEGSGNDHVVGNFIGTDVTGLSAAPNNIGILTNSDGDIIGSPSPGDRNIISGNNSSLPDVADGGGQPAGLGIDASDGDLIQGNYIGTDKTGTLALDNGGPFAHDGGAGIVGASNNTIGGSSAGAGNLISGNTYSDGVWLGGNQNVVAGNLIGTTATGLAALSNGDGITIWGNYNTIGGTTAGARNIISGSVNPTGAYGIDIQDVGIDGAQHNLVEGNYVGTDITGTIGLGLQVGISISGAYNTIGGATPAARNVISGNNSGGIGISGNSLGSFGNVIEGNYIGTDASGTTVVRNLGYGVALIWGTHDNTIGGTLPGAGNVISGFNGILLEGLPSIGLPCTNNLVQGNLIGTDKTGTVALGNGDGIDIEEANNNTIGGTTAGAGNTIAFSSGTGVDVDSGTANSILANSIFSNGGPGILLNSANNANDNQAAPVLTTVVSSAGGTAITGTLVAYPSTSFRIEFFSNPTGTVGEGQTFLGFAQVTTDSQGNFAANLPTALPPGTFLSATATDAAGSTSEFAAGDTVQGLLTVVTNNSLMLVGNNPPPLTGSVNGTLFTGSINYTTSYGDQLTVTLSTAATSSSAVGVYPIVATVTGAATANYYVQSSIGNMDVVTGIAPGSIYVLDPTAGGALTISGNAGINIPGNIVVDSNSSSALLASGNAAVHAAVISVKGNFKKSGNATLSPTPVTGISSIADPLASLSLPSLAGLTSYGAVSGAGNSSVTLSPGIYTSIQMSGNAIVTMSPGTYIIKGGGFSVSGNARVSGSGVFIFNAGSTYNGTTDGGSLGAITLSGNGTISLTPPTSGTYNGILIFQARDNTKALTLSGNAMQGITGTIYAATAQFVESGNAQVGSTNNSISLVVDTLTISGNAVANTLDSPPSGTVAFTPAQIRTAYGINNLTLDGTGQTIAIVDAYDDPSIYAAVDAFDTQFGLTSSGPTLFDQYGTASTFLTVLNQNGQATSLPTTDPSGAGADNWEVEEALDVEWTHAIAPGAQVVLVEANSQSLSDLMSSVATAASQPGVSVVSMSWGFTEGQAVFQSDEAMYDSYFTTPGVTFVASTGDYGTADPEYPAFSPNVLAVGGTSLNLNADNSYASESGWGGNDSTIGAFVGSGGGLSQYESEPTYQLGVQSTGSRTTPDVSFVADPSTGAWVADPYNLDPSNPFEVVGGTSLSAPAWAGLVALTNQGRAVAGDQNLNQSSPTETQQDLYSLSQADYNVISNGTNGGYNAAAGYNLVTGLGTPVANQLVPDLVNGNFPATGQVAPISATLNANPDFSASNADGTTNVINVFCALTMSSRQQPDSQQAADRTVATAPLAVPPANPGILAVAPAVAVPARAAVPTSIPLGQEPNFTVGEGTGTTATGNSSADGVNDLTLANSGQATDVLSYSGTLGFNSNTARVDDSDNFPFSSSYLQADGSTSCLAGFDYNADGQVNNSDSLSVCYLNAWSGFTPTI